MFAEIKVDKPERSFEPSQLEQPWNCYCVHGNLKWRTQRFFTGTLNVSYGNRSEMWVYGSIHWISYQRYIVPRFFSYSYAETYGRVVPPYHRIIKKHVSTCKCHVIMWNWSIFYFYGKAAICFCTLSICSMFKRHLSNRSTTLKGESIIYSDEVKLVGITRIWHFFFLQLSSTRCLGWGLAGFCSY